MAIIDGVIRIKLSWESLKNIASSKKILLQYEQVPGAYEIFCIDSIIAYTGIIFIGAVPDSIHFDQVQNDIDLIDFETNYKNIVTNFTIELGNSKNNPKNTKELRSSISASFSVAASIISVTLLPANDNRLGATVHNDSSVENLFLKLGAIASATSFTARLIPNGYYEVPFGYVGVIDAFWSGISGNARINELSL